VYTTGTTGAGLEGRLRAGEQGVLALADGDEAYVVVPNGRYDGDRLLGRARLRDRRAARGRRPPPRAAGGLDPREHEQQVPESRI
jgi:hypothetical protein